MFNKYRKTNFIKQSFLKSWQSLS